jgi:hypothetical protein
MALSCTDEEEEEEDADDSACLNNNIIVGHQLPSMGLYHIGLVGLMRATTEK